MRFIIAGSIIFFEILLSILSFVSAGLNVVPQALIFGRTSSYVLWQR
ncbi:MAG: hypothetical protein GXY01_08790 [Clostridiales bacterium]|nr:hypothetical protein [Clostridiales bacterium]